MEYILIDNFGDNLNIITKDNGSGEPLILNTLLAANSVLEEECQNGIIVPLNINIILLLQNCSDFINDILVDEGKENFENIDNILLPLNEILNK